MTVDRRLLTLVQAVALVAAIAISGYLTWMKANNQIPPCTAGGGCAAALYSQWGFIAGIPLAYIGLAAASVLLALTPWRAQPVRGISVALFLVGAIFTIYLRYVEQAHFDGNVCIWCVSFMAAWWVAGACELLRLVRPREPAPEPA
jgi:uncharacterized membrane protein